MVRDKRAGAVGAFLGLVLSLVVTATAAHASGVAESIRSSEVNVLTITSQFLGQVPGASQVVVRVSCTNNFDGDPNNNTFPGPSNDPLSPSNPDLVDGFVYLVFGFEQPATQRVFDAELADASNSCIVQQTESGSASQVVYADTSDDPDVIVETQQPPPGLGFAEVTWPTGAVDPAGDSARVTITTRHTPCPTGQPTCLSWEYVPTNTVRIKTRMRGDAPNPPSFSIRLRCSGGGVLSEHLLTFTDQTRSTCMCQPHARAVW